MVTSTKPLSVSVDATVTLSYPSGQVVVVVIGDLAFAINDQEYCVAADS